MPRSDRQLDPQESPYSVEHHREDPLRYPIHGACGVVWRQRGDRTGHCSRCHRNWEGVAVFDAHQRLNPDGSVLCLHPTDVRHQRQRLTLVDGAWRGPGMTDSALASLKESHRE